MNKKTFTVGCALLKKGELNNMEWTHVLAMILGNAAWVLPMFFWNRAEGRADARKADQDNKELRRELIDVMRSIDQEIKDFHGRLCAIEERRGK